MDYETLATKEVVAKTAAALRANGIEPLVVESGAEALQKVKELIPAGASVMNGSSRTLEQIGFLEYLKSDQHGWNNLHAAIVAEKDRTKQMVLRKQALLADYYLGSVHALTEAGESSPPTVAVNYPISFLPHPISSLSLVQRRLSQLSLMP